MNKRVWSVVVALAMLLSMICSVFVVSADETQADGSGATSLKLTPSASDIALGHEFTVDLSLANYESNWATFTTELTYNASAVEYLGFELKKASELSVASVEENVAGTLTIIFLNSENISADIAADLLTLKFKATADSTNPISASFVADSVAGYLADGTSDYIAEDSYSAAAVEPQILTEKKTPHLTMRLVDKNGNPVTSINQGDEIRAIVTLNDYYDPWMVMNLSLNYDATKFTYKEAKDLAAFVSDENGEMTMAVPDDTNNPLSVRFANATSANRSLKDGKKSADILELTLVANATAVPGETNIGASFADSGNSRFDPATGETVALTKDNDFLVDDAEGKGNVPVEIIEVIRPYLTLEDEDGKPLTNLTVAQGNSFTVNVKINNFHQKWSAMSLIAEFDKTVFDVTESAVQNANTTPLFGGYVFPVLGNGALGVTLLSSEGDVGLTNADGDEVTEGIVLKIPMIAKKEVDLSTINVFFAPDGNISGGKEVDDGLYNTNKDNPAKVEMNVVPQGQPGLSIQLDDSNIIVDENENPIIKQGESFTVNVKINNFYQKWSAMSFIAKFDSKVFEVDEDALQQGENKTGVFGDYVIPVLGNSGLGVTLLSENGDVSIDGGEGIIFRIPMKVNDNAVLNANTFPIEVSFVPEGNISKGEIVDKESYLNEPVKIDLNVVYKERPQVKIEAIQATDAQGNPVDIENDNLKAGDKVQFKVSVENFIDAWSIMTLQVGFDSDIFDPVLVSDELYATNLNPFDLNKAESADAFSNFFTHADNGELSAFWLNSEDLPMYNSESQEVMTFTLEVKKGYTLTDEQISRSISVKFHPDGNYVGEDKLEGSNDSNGGGDFVSDKADVTVKVEKPEAVLPVVKVEIAWEEAMLFTYSFGTWDTQNHVWKDHGWKCVDQDGNPANWIKVTNEGEVNVKAKFEFTKEVDGINATFSCDGNAMTAEEWLPVLCNPDGEALPQNVKFDLDGEPAQTAPEGEKLKLGTIKVTIDIDNEEET